jgi:hypothetical protein
MFALRGEIAKDESHRKSGSTELSAAILLVGQSFRNVHAKSLGASKKPLEWRYLSNQTPLV